VNASGANVFIGPRAISWLCSDLSVGLSACSYCQINSCSSENEMCKICGTTVWAAGSGGQQPPAKRRRKPCAPNLRPQLGAKAIFIWFSLFVLLCCSVRLLIVVADVLPHHSSSSSSSSSSNTALPQTPDPVSAAASLPLGLN